MAASKRRERGFVIVQSASNQFLKESSCFVICKRDANILPDFLQLTLLVLVLDIFSDG